jgi:hypothetical protein
MKPTLAQIRECVRTNRYVVTVHAAEETDDDSLTIFDVERLILAGEIVEKQKDKDPRETKVVIRGPILDGDNAFAVVKLGPTGKLVIVTVFRDIYG